MARSLASQSEQMRGIAGSLTESVLLAVESLGHKETLEGNTALRRGLALLPRCIAQLKHNGSIKVVAFSPDGGKLATGSIDGLARLWDVETGKELQRLEHDGVVYALAFNTDGSRLATGSGDKTARIWTLDIKKIMGEACSRVIRNMTREEWGRFVDDLLKT